MSDKKNLLLKSSGFSYFLSLTIIVIVYGAIPGISIPTLGQILWASGFAESFANVGGFAIKATNFGIPIPAPIPLGLPSTILQSFLIQFLGLHSADAYSVCAIFWLALSLFGAIKLCQLLGGTFKMGAALAPIYLTLPIVWVHAGYSYVSFGFALLPLYIYASLYLVYECSQSNSFSSSCIKGFITFSLVSMLSIFMDGYTFMMHAVGFLLTFLAAWIDRKWEFKHKFKIFIIACISLLFAYVVYTSYLSTTHYNPSSIDAFRGWGIDLVMLFRPSKGIAALWDFLQISTRRSGKLFFGDASVWQTTFSLPLILVSGFGLLKGRKSKFVLPLLLISILGFYLSLGPSLKFNSIRVGELSALPIIDGGVMPESAAIAPTGSAFISRSLPGFRNMRASYRWSGLMFTGFFGITVLLFLELEEKHTRKDKLISLFLTSLLIAGNCPNPTSRIWTGIRFREEIMEVDSSFSYLSQIFNAENKVVFLPIYNDFIVNYIASTGGYQTYNIGGDKNFEKARETWPYLLRTLPFGGAGECLTERVGAILQNQTADAVVLTYMDTLKGAHYWDEKQLHVEKQKQAFSSSISALRNLSNYQVVEKDLYSVVTLHQTTGETKKKKDGLNSKETAIQVGESCASRMEIASVLDQGWQGLDETFVWSGPSANLQLLPARYFSEHAKSANLELIMSTYAASEDAPQDIYLYLNDRLVRTISVTNSEASNYSLSLSKNDLKQQYINVRIEVPNATSPASQSLSEDDRRLGVALRRVELSENGSQN